MVKCIQRYAQNGQNGQKASPVGRNTAQQQ